MESKHYDYISENIKKEIEKMQKYLNDFKVKVSDEQKKCDEKWKKEVDLISKPLKLVIIAEAPLSFNSFFYNKEANFLKGLKDYYGLKEELLVNKMRENGILIFDIYQYPIPSKYYKDDKEGVLYDSDYIEKKLSYLKDEKKLLNNDTIFAFRYKMLIDRKLYSKPELKDLKYLIDDKGIPLSLFSEERPKQKLNSCYEDILK